MSGVRIEVVAAAAIVAIGVVEVVSWSFSFVTSFLCICLSIYPLSFLVAWYRSCTNQYLLCSKSGAIKGLSLKPGVDYNVAFRDSPAASKCAILISAFPIDSSLVSPLPLPPPIFFQATVTCVTNSGWELCLWADEFCLWADEFCLWAGEFCLWADEFCVWADEFCFTRIWRWRFTRH